RHTMDPTWSHCPYCEAEQKAEEQQVSSGIGGHARKRTIIEGDDARPAPSPRVRETRATENPREEEPADVTAPNDNSRIVGVLISYTRRREREIFPIREGKTYIGAGHVGAGGPRCDICIPDDKVMSGEHA